MRPLVVPVALLALLGAACDGDSGAPRTAPTPHDDITAAAALCTEVLNDRDAAAFEKGRDAAFQTIVLVRSDDAPDEDVRTTVRADLTALRDLLAEDLRTLREGSDVAGWDVVLAPVDDTVAALDARIEAVGAADWPPPADSLALGTTFATVEDEILVDAGLERLAGRDCAVLAGAAGPDPAAPEFAAAAAETCRAIVDRRQATGFADDARAAVELVLAVHQGEEVDPTDDDSAAVEAVRDEWQRTYDDLAAVPTADLGATAGWDAVVGLAEDRVAAFGRRLDALGADDPDAIAEAFDPAVLGAPGWDWDAVGLGQWDCRAITA